MSSLTSGFAFAQEAALLGVSTPALTPAQPAFVSPSLGAQIAAFGQFFSGFSAFQQGRFQADISRRNAAQTRLSTAARVEQVRDDRRRRLGRTKAVAGASGFAFSGNILDIFAQEARQAQRDAALTQFQGDILAQQQELQAKLQRNAALAGLIGGAVGGIGTIALSAQAQGRRGAIA